VESQGKQRSFSSSAYNVRQTSSNKAYPTFAASSKLGQTSLGGGDDGGGFDGDDDGDGGVDASHLLGKREREEGATLSSLKIYRRRRRRRRRWRRYNSKCVWQPCT